jgi:FKBP-type peptidyl-prolyl cis-trans isomerase
VDPAKAASKAEAIPPAPPTAKGETKTTASGVKYETLNEGTGPEARAGQNIKIHYTGTLQNGTKFDSSRDRGQPFPVTIGIGQVIKGWDEAVPGMKVGERRRLTIPPAAAYGSQGRPPTIPPDSTLIFDVELMAVE